MIVLTNLYPEHIESHGSFENYKAAKLEIFRHVASCKRKTIRFGYADNPDVQMRLVPKIAIVNGDSEYADEFLNFSFDKKIRFSKSDAVPTTLKGEHTMMNVAAAATVARSLGAKESVLTAIGLRLTPPPGRIEFIPEAEVFGFRVIVDYAFEPVAIAALYAVVQSLHPKRIIHVFGSTGGGRDVARRATVGTFVGQHADICIVTDEDPYDDDPMIIIRDVAKAVRAAGKVEGENLFEVGERKSAISKAIGLAQPGDIVLVTGKGSEQGMVVKGRILPWDDRQIVRDLLKHKNTTPSL